MKKIVLGAALCCCLITSQAMTGEEFQPMARDWIRYYNENPAVNIPLSKGIYALGYASATFDMVLNINAATHSFCAPPNVTYSQSVLIVHKFLNNHPEDLNLQLSDVYLDAFETYYPCHKTSGAKS